MVSQLDRLLYGVDVDDDVHVYPFPNEHACRIRDPGDFEAGSFRRIHREADGKPLDIIIGRLKGETGTTTQSFRYPKNSWTPAQARAHCREQDGAFEAASDQSVSPERDLTQPVRVYTMARDTVQIRPNVYETTIYSGNEDGVRSHIKLNLAGMDFSEYEANPIVLWQHGMDSNGSLPIGRTMKLAKTARGLRATFGFAEDSFAARVRSLWDQGIIRAASVGWWPHETEQLDDGYRDTRSSLIEWSLVAVPADPAAVRDQAMRLMRYMLTEPSDTVIFDHTAGPPVQQDNSALTDILESTKRTMRRLKEGRHANGN